MARVASWSRRGMYTVIADSTAVILVGILLFRILATSLIEFLLVSKLLGSFLAALDCVPLRVIAQSCDATIASTVCSLACG